jgi:hypothetical protein
MRSPRVRFTVRRVMVAVAVAAVILGTERLAKRRAEYGRQAEHHEATLGILALVRGEGVYPYCGLGITGIPLRYDAETAPLHARCVSYHTRMMRKYRRAMWLPWLAAGPDPPLPYPVSSYFDSGLSTR